MSNNFHISLEENLMKAYPPKKLKKLLTALKNNVVEVQSIIHHDFSSLHNAMEQYYHYLQIPAEQPSQPASSGRPKSKNNPADHSKKDFEKNHSTVKSNFNRIFTSLQFRDILSQKLSHIERILQAVIDELNHWGKALNSSKFLCEKKYLPIIPDIALVQTKQLEFIRHEYQTQIQKIINDLTAVDQYSRHFPPTNGASCLTISKELNLTRKSIESASQFDDSIDEIIRQLFSLSQKIIVPPMETRLKRDRIKMLEEFYTVESEWVVHREVFQTKRDTKEPPVNDFDGTVEIF